MKKWLPGIIWLLLLSIPAWTASYQITPTTSVGFKFAAFGIPNQLLDLFLYEHPQISGTAYGLEIRSYGEKGLQGVFSGLYSFEYSKMSGQGPWRINQQDRQLNGAGEVVQINVTASILLHLFPSLPVHPYIGAGIGLGRISVWSEGTYQDELGTTIKDSTNQSYVIPVGHIPVGISVNIMNKFEIRVEGGFKNGFYVGGTASYVF
jgi:opacity protein-like surface antigen